MDKNVLKKFAIESRQELMEKVANKINRYFVDEEFNVNQNGEVYILVNDKHTLRLTKSEYENRQLLVKRIKEITLEQVIEEAAYTWFNRIIAIRYMEIHDYLPLTKDNQSLGVRVLSSKDNTPDPEIMKISNLINPDLDIEFNKEYYGTIQDNNKRFEYILLLVCKKLGKVVPQIFDGVTDYIDILVPDNLLNDSGYVTKVLRDVSVENFEHVEIIGWLYQYYNTNEKNRVMTEKKNYNKFDIPYVTQLFTPDWIVKYMVENSLGKYWIEHGGDKELIKKWKYYIENKEESIQENIEPTTIKCIDPCSGSGHILVYMFEVLYQIYESYGYEKNNIPESILKNNLYGLDIDDRASQLTILSIILKAREYDKNIFNKKVIETLNIHSIKETNIINNQSIEIIDDNNVLQIARKLVNHFYDAKEYGSLLNVSSEEVNQYKILKEYLNNNDTIYNLDIKNKAIPVIKVAEVLANKYDIVITNPPYMAPTEKQKTYIEKKYSESKADLCAVFISRCKDLTKEDGYQAMITMHSWMFLSSFDKLREKIINTNTITSMLHLGSNAFSNKDVGTIVQTTAFVLKNIKIKNYKSVFVRLVDYQTPEMKEKEFFNINNKYITTDIYANIPGRPLAYWINEQISFIFANSPSLNDISITRHGMTTGNNSRFLRLWYEVPLNKIGFNMSSTEEAEKSKKKWFPYNKGGTYCKWYGNFDYVMNYENDGEEVKEYTSHLPQGTWVRVMSREYYFKPSITWSICGGVFAVRYRPQGSIFDVGGSSLFPYDENNYYYIIALLNSKVILELLKVLNPTINTQTGDIKNIPYVESNKKEYIEEKVKECIEIAKEVWDENEMSWDFDKHALISKNNVYIKDAFKEIESRCLDRYNTMKKNEEDLNRIFIDMYGLNNMIKPYVEEKDITAKKADVKKYITSFISYAVGCMFGRYSLDEEGLIYAGGEFNKNKYKTFDVDVDNIIPLTEDNYFGDDIVSRFKKFIEVVYGKETLYENLDFIAETLGKKNGENSEETIRRYFINDFYNDHVKMYQKRPIYWLFDSGKKNGFKCLIYMHRYNEGLVSKIRLDYLHRMQNTYEKELKEIVARLNNDVDLATKRDLSKRQADISAKLQETNEYDEKIAHIADQKIKIDLDDGVVVNYAKFSVKNPKTGKDESILAKIK